MPSCVCQELFLYSTFFVFIFIFKFQASVLAEYPVLLNPHILSEQISTFFFLILDTTDFLLQTYSPSIYVMLGQSFALEITCSYLILYLGVSVYFHGDLWFLLLLLFCLLFFFTL